MKGDDGTMRILFIGEVVGGAGVYCVKALLPGLKRELDIDLTIAAAEGATGGFGLGKGHSVYLHKLGVDVITTGDFAYFKRDIVSHFAQARYLLRPANYPYGNPGRGWLVAHPQPPQRGAGRHRPAGQGHGGAARPPRAAGGTPGTEGAPRPAPAGARPLPATAPPVDSVTPAVAPGDPEHRSPTPAAPALAVVPAAARTATASHPHPALGVEAPAASAPDATANVAPDSDTATSPALKAPPAGAPDATGKAAATRAAAGKAPPNSARRPAPGIGVLSLLGQAGFARVHLHSPFESVGGLIDRIKQQTPIVLVDFHATTTSEKVAMSMFLDGKVTAVLGTHVRTLSADARLLPSGTAAITHSGRTGSLHSVGGLDPAVETRKFINQVHEQSRDAWGLLELQGVVLEVGADGKAQSITTLRRQTTAPEAAREAAEAQQYRGRPRGRPGGKRR